jgi:hypothetical protein
MHGKKLSGLMTVWDAYATFAALAGADPTDHRAAAAGLPPIDSVDMWPYLSGQRADSPRKRVEIGATTCATPSPNCINNWGWGDVRTIVEGLIVDRGAAGVWKLLVGRNPMSGWQGPLFPNASTPKTQWSFHDVYECGPHGCLFKLDDDPTEHVDLRQREPDIAAAMLAEIVQLNHTTFSPYRGPGEQNGDIAAACAAAEKWYGGFFGPFLRDERGASALP